MRNKTVAIILAVVALVVLGLFVIKPLLVGKLEERTLICKESGERFTLQVKIGSVPPYINPKTGKPTLFNGYFCKWRGKDGKTNEKWIIEGTEQEHGIEPRYIISEESKDQKK